MLRRRVPSPNPAAVSELSAVSGDWAVGYDRTSNGVSRPLILHWTGAHWRTAPVHSGN
jgi:hypothetical protein